MKKNINTFFKTLMLFGGLATALFACCKVEDEIGIREREGDATEEQVQVARRLAGHWTLDPATAPTDDMRELELNFTTNDDHKGGLISSKGLEEEIFGPVWLFDQETEEQIYVGGQVGYMDIIDVTPTNLEVKFAHGQTYDLSFIKDDSENEDGDNGEEKPELLEVFVTPDGAGEQTGESWANAVAGNKANGLNDAIELLSKEGRKMHIGGGTYDVEQHFELKIGGTSADDMLEIIGDENNMPVFVGGWDADNQPQSATFLKVMVSQNFWKISNIKIKNYRFGIDLNGRHVGGRLNNIEIDMMDSGILMRGNATTANPEVGTHDLIVENCHFTHYTKRGIRINGGNYNVTIKDCTADQGGKAFWRTGNWGSSFHVADGNADGIYDHDITYINVKAGNNYHEHDVYSNADSFVSERNAYNLKYVGCYAYANTDGGWDDKSQNPLLIDCISAHNKRNYRFWSEGREVNGEVMGAEIYNSVSLAPKHVESGVKGSIVGAGSFGSDKTMVTFFKSTFYHSDQFEILSHMGTITLNDCIIASDNSEKLHTNEGNSGVVVWDTTIKFNPNGSDGHQTDADPNFNNPSEDWTGGNSAFDSQQYPDKGYSSSRTGQDIQF